MEGCALQVRVAAALARIAAQPEQKLPDKQARLDSWMARLVAKQKEFGADPTPFACFEAPERQQQAAAEGIMAVCMGPSRARAGAERGAARGSAARKHSAARRAHGRARLRQDLCDARDRGALAQPGQEHPPGRAHGWGFPEGPTACRA